MAKTTKKSSPKGVGRGDIVNYGWNEAEKALNKVRKEVAKTIVAGAVGGIGAKVASGVRGAVAAKKVANKAPYVKTTKGTQAKNAEIKLKAPGSKKSGSPKAGTQATIKKVVEPAKGAPMAGAKAAKKTSKTTRGAGVALYGVGKAVETAYKVGKDQGKKEAKKNKK
jgi:hypothetical protein